MSNEQKVEQKAVRFPSTKEEIKAELLDKVAEKIMDQWHSQKVHKIATALWFLNILEIKDQGKRDMVLEAWQAKTPGAFGTNCSALGQALGREGKAPEGKKVVTGF